MYRGRTPRLYFEIHRVCLLYTSVYGCAQNEADMELIRGMLEQMGFAFTSRPEEADLILINTCAVREGAEFRIYGNVGEFKRLKEKNRKLTIVVCGCMMQQKQVVEKMQRSYPYVDIIFGTHNIARFPLLLQQRYETGNRVTEILENGTFTAVSYTHLDVYKRQPQVLASRPVFHSVPLSALPSALLLV